MLAQITVSGLAMGVIYALIALGYVFVWNTMAIVNFAAGEFVTFAAYVFVATFITQLGFPFWLALLAAAAAMAVLGAVFSRVVFARLQKQRALVAIISTVGFGIFLKELARILYGPEPLMYTGPFGSGGVTLGGITIAWQQVLILGVAVAVTVVQGIVLKRTMIGKVMRAVAVDRDTAALMGIPVQKVLAGTFAYSSVLAALAGMLLAPLFFVTTEMGSLVGLKGFVAMIIGGFGSIPGAILGGLLLGLGENWAAYLVSSTYKDVIAFVLLLLFLAMRPQGLLPERTADRA
jgi:branched-chain amino acid transport system permease protein